tara:strand:+ start:351 stop:590 length:240 start_codon:yes stop_codon:yes gene_type:complete
VGEQQKHNKFKIGDLVTNKHPIELAFEAHKIKKGEVGLVVEIISLDEINLSGYDYIVLMKGQEVFFFQNELILYKSTGE